MTGTGGGHKRKAISEINVTPLVDVMLVLLIIFMVSTPLIVKDEQERVVDLELPVTRDNPNTVDLSDTDKLILQIDANLRITLGDTVISDCSAALEASGGVREFAEACEPCFAEVQDKLGDNARLQGNESLYLLADTRIPYGFVVGTMNRIRMAGVTNVGMVTNPEFLSQTGGATPFAEEP